MIDEYNIKYITAGLHTQRVGRWMRLYQQVSSTNDLARMLIESEGAPDGGVVISEYQSNGRGRQGRSWTAPPRSSILASFILRPEQRIAAAQAFALTFCLASATRAALRGLDPSLDVQLKWPNDIMVNGNKLGGILSEVGFSDGQVSWAALGLGLNANLSQADLISLPLATSLSIELGHNVDRTALCSAICDEFEPRYLALQAGEYAALWREWMDSLCWLGREVSISEHGDITLVGKLLTVEQDGSLVVQPADGERQRVRVGDLSLRLR